MRHNFHVWTTLLYKFAIRGCRHRQARYNGYKRKLRFERCEERRVLTTFTVNVDYDVVSWVVTDSEVSLREAVERTEINPNEDIIDFAPGLTGATITLGKDANGNPIGTGEISITESVTIDGRNSSGVSLGITIDARGNDSTPLVKDGLGTRIFSIYAFSESTEVEINGLTLTGGDVEEGYKGGAIYSTANLTIKNTVITGNASESDEGGGIAAFSNLTIENSTISENSSGIGAGGGGIAFRGDNKLLKVLSSIISGNQGGGIFVYGYQSAADIQSSQITGNEGALVGGGIFFSGKELNLESSTICGNQSSGSGGGLYAKVTNGSIVIDEATIEMNRSTGYNSGGAGAYLSVDHSSVTITATTISDNEAQGDEANIGGIGIKAENDSIVVLNGLEIIGNHADDDIGGLFVLNTASEVTVKNSTISGNTANHNGGPSDFAAGVWLEAYSGASTIIEYSTISDNSTITLPGGNGTANVAGGGLFIKSLPYTTTTIRSSTISGNQAHGDGGGIKINELYSTGGEVLIQHSTITKNRADSDGDNTGSGGGIHVGNSNTLVIIEHTIIAENFRGTETTHDDDDISGAVTLTWSLIGVDTDATITDNGGNQIGTGTAPIVPGLAPTLADNGGPTMTHALLSTSPAVNAGDPSIVFSPTAFDQRGDGYQRVKGGRIDLGAFELLVGDYDRNGEVECADYVLWRATFGSTTDLRADGNGNSVIDAADYVVWANEYDAIAGGPIGDFDGDGETDLDDYGIWRATFGSTTDLRADANCDGVVNAADYVIWRDTYKSKTLTPMFGLLGDMPPAVLGFALFASSNSFDFTGVIGSGEQLRSVPLAGINSISITFNQAVTATQGALQLINLDGSAPSVTGFSYDSTLHTATWTLGASLADGRYLVRLADSVQNGDNEALDGEFTNPWSFTQTGSSVLPSGDGVAGGEFRFRFTVLAGDTDHNNIDGATNYQNWKSTEPGRVYVSTTTDDFDADLSFGDVSLREAVDYANTSSEPTTIEMPAGHYYLTRSGTESTTNTEFNDLDIFGNVRIVGAGPGATVVDGGSLTTDDRLFDVANLGVLRVFGATLALGAAPTGSTQRDGGAVRVKDGGQLDLDTVAVVGNETTRAGYGGAVYFAATAHGSITDSVITVNYADNMTGGVYLKNASAPGAGGTVTVTRSIIVNNTAADTNNTDVYAGTNRTFTSGGYNRLGNAATGFTNGVNGDYIKPTGTTVHYVVTSIVDTYDGSADPVNMSVRDAIHLANTTAGTQEIWLPAWDFVLTRERTTAANLVELNVSEGDLEILQSTIIRGIGGASAPATSVGWVSGAVADKVFELVGDGSGNGEVDTSDYVIWQNQENQTGPGLAADLDDDGDVDEDDYDLWAAKYGYTLALLDVDV